MKKFQEYTLTEYLNQLSAKEPVPGGGSAAALSSALGAALICMVVRYSLGKGKSKSIESRLLRILQQSEASRARLLTLVDLDSEAYLEVCRVRKLDKISQRKAARQARKVPQEICKLSFRLVESAPFVVEHGNPYLLSDIEVALELLMAGYQGALVMVKVNQ